MKFHIAHEFDGSVAFAAAAAVAAAVESEELIIVFFRGFQGDRVGHSFCKN